MNKDRAEQGKQDIHKGNADICAWPTRKKGKGDAKIWVQAEAKHDKDYTINKDMQLTAKGQQKTREDHC